jgi:hypothetical protein
MTTETKGYLVLATPLKNVWSIYQGKEWQLRLRGTLSWQLHSRMFGVSIKIRFTTETLRYLVLATPLKNVWSIYQGKEWQLRLCGTLSWQLHSRMFGVSIKVRFTTETLRYLVLATPLKNVWSIYQGKIYNWDSAVPCPGNSTQDCLEYLSR